MGKRGSRGGRSGPKPLSRNERRGEAGFVVYCKCDKGFKQHRPELLQQQPWRRGQCSKCGALKPEWRCPVHKLLAVPLERGIDSLSAGCPRCGRAPKEQRYDQYMTALAKAGK